MTRRSACASSATAHLQATRACTSWSRRRRGEGGQETLQTIIVVALVLLPVLLAILTFGSLVHISIAAQAAAASGARAAGAAGVFGPDEARRLDDELRGNGVDPGSCAVTVAPAGGEVSLGQPISVTVSCPQHVGIPFLLDRDVTLTSTFTARGEVNR